MSVIVEGVETVEELIYLEAATRIRVAQGYYFAMPMSFDEIPRGKAQIPGFRRVRLRRAESTASRSFQHRTPRRTDSRTL